MLKNIGYYLFASIYYLCRPLPIDKRRVLGIMTHDDGDGSNVRLIINRLKEKDSGYSFSYILKKDTLAIKKPNNIRTILSFFFIKPYELARSGVILLDNVFLPLAFIKVKKNVRVIQLWHGTGTIKRFGQDVNTGRLKKLEKSANSNITHLIVNSPDMKRLYSRVFGVEEEKVYITGLPKTDVLLELINRNNNQLSSTPVNNYQENRARAGKDKEYIYNKYSIPAHKKLILYAPTFRDDETDKLSALKIIDEIIKELPEDYHLGVRLHPFIADNIIKPEAEAKYNGRLSMDMSHEEDINLLLMAADILITDYSSIIYEYCLTGRPMIFFAYDLDKFSSSGRGFYYDYEDYVPGPVARTTDELNDIIKSGSFNCERVHKFRENNFPLLDGKAADRIIALFENK